MQQTHTNKAVTRRVKAKNVLSHRRQSEYIGTLYVYSRKWVTLKQYIKATTNATAQLLQLAVATESLKMNH